MFYYCIPISVIATLENVYQLHLRPCVRYGGAYGKRHLFRIRAAVSNMK